jgi:hypothetical protein
MAAATDYGHGGRRRRGIFSFPSVGGSSGWKRRQSTADAGDSNQTQWQTTVRFFFDGDGGGGSGGGGWG